MKTGQPWTADEDAIILREHTPPVIRSGSISARFSIAQRKLSVPAT